MIIPKKYQTDVIRLLHDGHPCMSKMKSLARLHVWWPSIDKYIENHVQSCQNCGEVSRTPTKVPLHPWDPPSKSWERLHIDFCGPFEKKMWLVVIDAYSKWPQIHMMEANTTTSSTFEKLQDIFAILGLPEIIVSDNDPQFTAQQFGESCTSREIKHTATPPYHPKSNGEAERLVGSFKTYMKKAHSTQTPLSYY